MSFDSCFLIFGPAYLWSCLSLVLLIFGPANFSLNCFRKCWSLIFEQAAETIFTGWCTWLLLTSVSNIWSWSVGNKIISEKLLRTADEITEAISFALGKFPPADLSICWKHFSVSLQIFTTPVGLHFWNWDVLV